MYLSKNKGTIVTCHGYGTDPKGEISQISRSAVEKTVRLMKKKGLNNLLLVGDYSFNGGLTEGKLLEKTAKKLFGKQIKITYIEGCMDSIQLAQKLDIFLRQNGNIRKLISVCWKPHSGRVLYTLQKVCKPLRVALEVVFVEAPFGNNSQRRLNNIFYWNFFNFFAWVMTLMYFLMNDIYNDRKKFLGGASKSSVTLFLTTSMRILNYYTGLDFFVQLCYNYFCLVNWTIAWYESIERKVRAP